MDEQKVKAIQDHLNQIRRLVKEMRIHYSAVVDTYDDLDMMSFTFPVSIEINDAALQELLTCLERKENVS